MHSAHVLVMSRVGLAGGRQQGHLPLFVMGTPGLAAWVSTDVTHPIAERSATVRDVGLCPSLAVKRDA